MIARTVRVGTAAWLLTSTAPDLAAQMGTAPGLRGDSLGVYAALGTRPAALGLASSLRERISITGSSYAQPLRPIAAPPPWLEGSITLAVGETLFVDFVGWMADEYGMPWKDISRTGPSTWLRNFSYGPVWDDNHFHINWLTHPLQGTFFYSAGRTNSYDYARSFLFTVLGSSIWECCGESHRASINDLVTTTVGGAALGEALYRIGTRAIYERGRAWQALGYVLTPYRWITGAILDRRPPDRAVPEQWELPGTMSVTVSGGGLRWKSRTEPPLLLERRWAGFLKLSSTYGDFTDIEQWDDPFSHFEIALELQLPGKQLLSRLEARGLLWPFLPTWRSAANRWSLHVVPFQAFDYVNKTGYEFGAQSLGFAAALAYRNPSGFHFAFTADGRGLFGGVMSKYAPEAVPEDVQEREREYDFGAGWGIGAGALVGFTWGQRTLRASVSFHRDDLNVLHGSNLYGDADHDARFIGGSFVASKIVGPLGLGVDVERFRQTSEYEAHPAERRKHTEIRLYATFDLLDTPLGLFPF